MKYICNICGWIYDPVKGDPEGGIPPGTAFKDIPDSWFCPLCGATKADFSPIKEEVPKPDAKTNDEMTLKIARENARKKLSGVCTVNKVCDGQANRLCQGMKYGEKLGFGGEGQGRGFANNFNSLQKVKLKMRLVTTHQIPDISADLFGEKLAFPVLAAPMSGQTSSFNNAITERDFAFAICKGAFEAGTLGGTGNSPREGDVEAGIDSIQKLEGKGIPFFKPQPNDNLIPLYQKAEKMGCPAVGSDLDGAGSFNWNKAGKPVERKNLDQLKELVNCVKIPVIFKGIMCAEDANIVAESGAKGLAVSNHGGRVLDSTPGTAEVLPEIADAVDDNVTIFVDGAVRTGFDVLKMLALGADFVFIGRPLAQCAIGGGHEAVKLYLETVAREFKKAMVMTGTNSLKDINEKIICGQ